MKIEKSLKNHADNDDDNIGRCWMMISLVFANIGWMPMSLTLADAGCRQLRGAQCECVTQLRKLENELRTEISFVPDMEIY